MHGLRSWVKRYGLSGDHDHFYNYNDDHNGNNDYSSSSGWWCCS